MLILLPAVECILLLTGPLRCKALPLLLMKAIGPKAWTLRTLQRIDSKDIYRHEAAGRETTSEARKSKCELLERGKKARQLGGTL